MDKDVIQKKYHKNRSINNNPKNHVRIMSEKLKSIGISLRVRNVYGTKMITERQ